MATITDLVRPDNYRRFEREVPRWYTDAKLGVFVHWGPYSVPAWAEPIGELGTIDDGYWFTHNPYAEWYFNTIRIAGSPAAEHHREAYGDAPYDDFLDAWDASAFDPAELLALVKSTGAGYFVPTTKHHDGVTLWDAPGTGDRNTVARGPRRDLVAAFERATREAGLRFGVYYSGGLDWHVSQLPPITAEGDAFVRPVDAGYAEYAHAQVADLIDRYAPDVLWNDIDWPDAGKPSGPFSAESLFERFYAANPQGVTNDRWGATHWDYRTSEYQQDTEVERSGAWENCRGIGYSFGYNSLEDESHLLSGPAAVTTFVDIVSRGGNLLLNIGLTASGTVPELQRRTLEHLAAWNAVNGDAVFGSTPLDTAIAGPSETPWLRWTRTGETANAFVDAAGEVRLPASAAVDAASARLADGNPVAATRDGDAIVLTLPRPELAGPTLVRIGLRG
ncbi:alpha-L-fucosidase [uncultured Leifsonia sp.]|uniref:alpha-L-fucosidase n=1 Tax=uncultured Leifsonia sp. TaxID=340359 RepID=UPI0028D36B31|nr:alpha-L-fucosidase [uncultured Leifsonia sp.]